MTPLREGPRIQTRLSMKEYLRFQRHMRERDLSIGQLARDAICFYLDRLDEGVFDERETQVEQRLSSFENKMQPLLEATAIDVAILISLVYSRMNKETREEQLKKTHHLQTARIRERIDKLEKLNRPQYKAKSTKPIPIDSASSSEAAG